MNRFIIDEFHRDPALRQRLIAMAHRERSRAVRAGLTWLANRIRALAATRIHVRWTERLG